MFNYDKSYVHLENENDREIDKEKLIFIEKLDWTEHDGCSLFENELNKNIDLILATGINISYR